MVALIIVKNTNRTKLWIMYRIVLSLSVFILFAYGTLRSQTSLTTQAFAEVIEVLTVNETEQLNFGRFSTESGGGQIIVTPDGVRSAYGSVILAEGFHSPGRFRLSGTPGASFTIQLPQSSSLLVHRSSGQTMTVENWISDPPSGETTTILANGMQFISIGALLSVGSIEKNPVGSYAGTFQLTFVYN